MKKRFENKIVLKRSRKDFEEKKELARALVQEKVVYFNTFYQFNIKAIRIRNTTSRWGSCSSKGNLNFNYGIVYLPPELVDYIVVHELCHLKEFNHSKNFWNLVGEVIPDYKVRRMRLKKNLFRLSRE